MGAKEGRASETGSGEENFQAGFAEVGKIVCELKKL